MYNFDCRLWLVDVQGGASPSAAIGPAGPARTPLAGRETQSQTGLSHSGERQRGERETSDGREKL